jgi:hypothetical protein
MYGYKYFKSFLFLILATILFSCGGDEDMTLINSENFTGFGDSPFKVMKIYEKDVSVLGNNLAETDPLNLTEFNEALYNTQHNVAFLSNGVTTADNTESITTFSALQSYFAAIKHNDYNITITVDGGGYAGENLLIEDISGSGEISIVWGTASDELASIAINNIKNKITLSGVKQDSAPFAYAYFITDSDHVELSSVESGASSTSVGANNSYVVVNNIKINSGVGNAFFAEENAQINVESANPTSTTISNIVYNAKDGGRIIKMQLLNIFTTGSVFENCSEGGQIIGHFGLGQFIDPVTKTIYIPAGTTTENANQIILNSGSNIPTNATLKITLATTTYTGTAPLTISNFYGGGEIELEGNGTGSIIPGLLVSENRVKIEVSALEADGASTGTIPVIHDLNNSKRTEYSNIEVADSGSGACFGAEGSSNVYIGFSTLIGNIGISADDQSHVASQTNTGANTAYGLYALDASVITKMDANQPTGAVSEETTNGGIIR